MATSAAMSFLSMANNPYPYEYMGRNVQLPSKKLPRDIQCLSPAKNYKLYKSSINKSIHFVQRSLSSSPRGQRVTAQLNLSRE